jgi:hypothetical protein
VSDHTPGKLLAIPPDAGCERWMLARPVGVADVPPEKYYIALLYGGEGDARRLVACWNACDGLSTEHLEAVEPGFEALYAAADARALAKLLRRFFRKESHHFTPEDDALLERWEK